MTEDETDSEDCDEDYNDYEDYTVYANMIRALDRLLLNGELQVVAAKALETPDLYCIPSTDVINIWYGPGNLQEKVDRFHQLSPSNHVCFSSIQNNNFLRVASNGMRTKCLKCSNEIGVDTRIAAANINQWFLHVKRRTIANYTVLRFVCNECASLTRKKPNTEDENSAQHKQKTTKRKTFRNLGKTIANTAKSNEMKAQQTQNVQDEYSRITHI